MPCFDYAIYYYFIRYFMMYFRWLLFSFRCHFLSLRCCFSFLFRLRFRHAAFYFDYGCLAFRAPLFTLLLFFAFHIDILLMFH